MQLIEYGILASIKIKEYYNDNQSLITAMPTVQSRQRFWQWQWLRFGTLDRFLTGYWH